eukprot:5648606-Pyramimonas_sp.AAC.1
MKPNNLHLRFSFYLRGALPDAVLANVELLQGGVAEPPLLCPARLIRQQRLRYPLHPLRP